jgi:hypothetical protein
MAAKLIILTHKIALQLHLVAESCTICSSRSRRLVRELLDTPSYVALWFETPPPPQLRWDECVKLNQTIGRKSIYVTQT